MSRCCLISLLFSHSSHVRLFATPWTAAHQASLSFTISRSLLKFMSVESEMPFNHCILCRPLKLALHIRWPKYWSFNFSIGPSNEYSELISFRIDWFAVLEVQFSSVTQLCPTLCDPMDCSMTGFPVHHQLPEFTQTHVH